jgi:hypothetical protein
MHSTLNTETSPSTATPKPKNLWDRLPSETADAYAAFTTYLELGVGATLQQVAQKLGTTLESIKHHSSRHSWMERAAAYRQYLSSETLLALHNQRIQQTHLCHVRDAIFRQQNWEASQALAHACHQALDRLMADQAARIEPYELARFFDLFHKLGCRANAPTGFTSDGPVPPDDEWDETVRKIYGEGFSMEKYAHLIRPPAKASPPLDGFSPSSSSSSCSLRVSSSSSSSTPTGVPPRITGHLPNLNLNLNPNPNLPV